MLFWCALLVLDCWLFGVVFCLVCVVCSLLNVCCCLLFVLSDGWCCLLSPVPDFVFLVCLCCEFSADTDAVRLRCVFWCLLFVVCLLLFVVEGCASIVVRCLLLAVYGSLFATVACWLLVFDCLVFVVCGLLSVVCCVFFVFKCLLRAGYWPLPFAVNRSLSVAWLLVVDCWLWFGVCCLLFGVRCVLLVMCSLYVVRCLWLVGCCLLCCCLGFIVWDLFCVFCGCVLCVGRPLSSVVWFFFVKACVLCVVCVCRVLFSACCALFAVCCLLFVVC